MLQAEWHKTIVTSVETLNAWLIDAHYNIKEYHEQVYTGFDTETTGLNIGYDLPFIAQYGYINKATLKGSVIAFELTPENMHWLDVCNELCALSTKHIGANIKYDMHMLSNVNMPIRRYDNLTDLFFWIRYAHDALHIQQGGPPLALKSYAQKYVDRAARTHEKELDKERTDIAKAYNNDLKQRLGVTLKALDELTKDTIAGLGDLTEEQQEIYKQWRMTLPPAIRIRAGFRVTKEDVPYTMLKRKTVLEYALMDVVYTLESFLVVEEAVLARGTLKAVQIENQLIEPLYYMEQTGFKIDVAYLREAKKRMKAYIIERRAELQELAGQKLSVGQHQLIRKILKEDYDVYIHSASKAMFEQIEHVLVQEEKTEALEFIEYIIELRSLEKWYATYILRFLKALRITDRLYTQINQVGTVSGRVTSDFQQFPRQSIRTHDGRELFHPRRMIITDKEKGYDYSFYLDYSQIELRIQAMYTILVGTPDENLCRAYMPYNCVSGTGDTFTCENANSKAYVDQLWYLKESPEVLWQPTDVHAATTCLAFNVTPSDPRFKDLRYEGKRVNFAKNYGAGLTRIKEMFPHATEEEAQRIDEAYYKAFPGVKTYHDYCFKLAETYPYAENLFGVKYYNVRGHNLRNMMIQGSGAYLLKTKLIEIWDYIKTHRLRMRIQMNIHDEISFLVPPEEIPHILNIQNIMESWEGSLVPIVADIEYTTTNWAEKQDAQSITSLLHRSRVQPDPEVSRETGTLTVPDGETHCEETPIGSGCRERCAVG